MKYSAKRHPSQESWAVFLDDEQITWYSFPKNEAKALASAKQRQMNDLMDDILLGGEDEVLSDPLYISGMHDDK